ncbi:MAG: hypothetical protein U0821_20095 [Chloroflexota bacterium]
MRDREDLEREARRLADQLLLELVERSEDVDFRQGTYLLASLAAELGSRVQERCWQLARDSHPNWEMPASEAETLINAAWKSMASIWAETEREARRG